MCAKKIMIAVGGTGGHVYPAIGFVSQFLSKHPLTQILFVGGGLCNNRYFDQTRFPFRTIFCGKFSRNKLLHWPKNAWNIFKGIKESRQIIQEFVPDLILGFGSFYTLPVLIAAKSLSIPIVLHEANSIPGKVNRLFSGHVLSTGIHFPCTASFLNGPSALVGMPLREGYDNSKISKEEALKYFGMSADQPILLVFGGSQGARYINQLMKQALTYCTHVPFQLLHFTGDSQMTKEIKTICHSLNRKVVVKEFENRMDLAWKVADMVVSRSGASTIAEAIEFTVPALFIPYPYATEKHQHKNADFIVNEISGAYSYTEDELNPQVFVQKLEELMENNQIKLHEMRRCIGLHKAHHKTHHFCSWIEEMLNG